MEYTFRNSPDDHLRTIFLTDKHLLLVVDGARYEYAYTEISKVWLNNPGGFCSPGDFSCTVNIADKKPVFISSKNYADNGKVIKQDNFYNSFIRVLHLHMKDNAATEFRFGASMSAYITRVFMILGILTTCIAMILLTNINIWLLTIPSALGIFVSICGLKFCLTRFPKGYNPKDIPLTLLPG